MLRPVGGRAPTIGLDGQIVTTPEAAPLGPYNGGPVAPNAPPISTWDSTPEPIAGQYHLNPQNPSSTKSFNMWRQLATAQGPTQFGQQNLNQIQANKQKQIGAASQQAGGSFGAAVANLSSRGGINATQRAALTTASNNQQMLAKQAAYRGAQGSTLDAQKSDEALKLEAQERVGQMESTYNTQAQEAAYRKYQLDLAKWAASVGQGAYNTFTGNR